MVIVSGCGQTIAGRPLAANPANPANPQPSASTAPTSTPARGGGAGPVGETVATSLRVRAENIRLVRSGEADLALQFEFVNDSAGKITPSDMGIIANPDMNVRLVDLPRGTSYRTDLSAEALPWHVFPETRGHPRVSRSTQEDVAPGGSATVTVMFPAPPAETTSMMVTTDAFLPVSVPVQPKGSSALRDDPIVHTTHYQQKPLSDLIGPLVCAATPTATTEATQIRLPSDVLFAFGSAELSPAAGAAIDSLAKQVSVASGTVSIEGHTDAIGDDASNQTLSERRAAAARDAIAAKLGTSFQYGTAGFGESKPVAPNTKADGSDDPDGRAQNRRVEVTVSSAGATTPAKVREPANTELAGTGLVPTVRSVQIMAGFAMAQVEIHNPGTAGVPLGYLNDSNRNGAVGIRPDNGGELSLVDPSGTIRNPCVAPGWWQNVASGYPVFERFGGDRVAPGSTVVMWALFAAPPADQRAVTVGIGGFTPTGAATQLAGR